MSTATTYRAGQAGIGRALVVGLVAGLIAGAANLVVRLLAGALGAPFLVPMGPGAPAEALPIFAIIAACVLPGLAAAVLYWGLGRLTGARATTIFLIVSAVFALLSLGGPLTLPIDLGTRLALGLMHLVAGAIIAGGLVRFAPQG